MTSSPDTIIGALEDGHRPPQDPDDWERVKSLAVDVESSSLRSVIPPSVRGTGSSAT